MRHGHDRRSEAAAAWRSLYKTSRWQKLRAQQLRTEPLCQRCQREGRVTEAKVCHHMDKASKEKFETFFAGPFESRCKPCHDTIEQSIERLGYEKGCDETGFPVDPEHPWSKKKRE